MGRVTLKAQQATSGSNRSDVVAWSSTAWSWECSSDILQRAATVRLREPSLFFRLGIAHATIGAVFSARVHRIPGVFDMTGADIDFQTISPTALCLLNSASSAFNVESP